MSESAPTPAPPRAARQRRPRSVVLILATAVLVVGGVVTAFVLTHREHGSRPTARVGQGPPRRSGPWTVNGYAYVNACNALPYDSVKRILGDVAKSGAKVSDEYAEKIPPGQQARGISSLCRYFFTAPGGARTENRLDLRIAQFGGTVPAPARTALVPGPPATRSPQPVPGAPGATLQTVNNVPTLHFVDGTVVAEIGLRFVSAMPPATALADLVNQVRGSYRNPDSAPKVPVTPMKTGSGRSADPCSVFTAGNFQKGSGIASDQGRVKRWYSVGTVAEPQVECERYADPAASGSAGYNPFVYVDQLPSPTAAIQAVHSRYAAKKGTPVAGVGSAARYYPNTGEPTVELVFAVGDLVAELGLSRFDDVATWTPARVRQTLTRLAAAIAADMH